MQSVSQSSYPVNAHAIVINSVFASEYSVSAMKEKQKTNKRGNSGLRKRRTTAEQLWGEFIIYLTYYLLKFFVNFRVNDHCIQI